MGRALKLGTLLGGLLSLVLAGMAAGFVRPTQNPSISGTPTVGSLLKCNPGTWDGPVDSYDYSWSLSSGSGAPFATGQTWQADQAHVNQDVVCNVTAHASDGTTTTATSPMVIIEPRNANPCHGPLRSYTGRSSQGLEVDVDLTGPCVTEVRVTYRAHCTGTTFAERNPEFTYDVAIHNTPLDAQQSFKIETSRKPRGWGKGSREIVTATGLVRGHTATGTFRVVTHYYLHHRLVAVCRAPRSVHWSASDSSNVG